MIRGLLQLFIFLSCDPCHDGEVAGSDNLDWQCCGLVLWSGFLVCRSDLARSPLACSGDVLCQCDPAVCSASVLFWSGGAVWFDGLGKSLIACSGGVLSSA
jgi:hypothetical protein